MKIWHALLMNVVVVGVGLFAYDKLRCGDGRGAPLSAAEMERFEQQFEELQEQRSKNFGQRSRFQAYVKRMRLGLDRATESKLVTLVDKFHSARIDWFKSVTGNEADYEARYRAFVGPHIARIEALVPDRAASAAIIQRLVFDGRIIKPPSKDAKQGQPIVRTPQKK